MEKKTLPPATKTPHNLVLRAETVFRHLLLSTVWIWKIDYKIDKNGSQHCHFEIIYWWLSTVTNQKQSKCTVFLNISMWKTVKKCMLRRHTQIVKPTTEGHMTKLFNFHMILSPKFHSRIWTSLRLHHFQKNMFS